MNNTHRAIANVASKANAVGFDPTLIISGLIPLLLNCFSRERDDETPKQFLESHYDHNTNTFDQSLINRCRRQTRIAAREQGRERLSRDELDVITSCTLHHAMSMPDDEVEAVAIEAGIQLK